MNQRGNRFDRNSRGRKRTRINRQIYASEVRLIGAEGQQVGVVSVPEALKLAEEVGLDLVEIAPNVKPPVCRIMDYGKYLYEQKKKSKQKVKTKAPQLKELKMRPNTDIGDYMVRIKRAIGFLQEGSRVKFVVQFRGREMAYKNQGRDLLERVVHDLVEYGTPEQSVRMEGRNMMIMIMPGKKAEK